MPEPHEWSRAFAIQARADLHSYNICCVNPAFPLCHRFHFLQMACEKLAKAYLCAGGSDPLVIQTSHAYTAKVLPVIVRQAIAAEGQAALKKLSWLADGVRPLMREIELLSPSVDDGGRRPSNCEYPWTDTAGKLHVPTEQTFPNLASLYSPMGRELLKIIERAAARLINDK